ncbi:hypothetical protein MMSR116_27300 [Methylobacterium mesophilicum SR1.6/6]|uniref:ImmA/IrrE family metallo-endopeptidase n=1 Tax=Methylobacterium mesophilicum SR1.6/6 TaxID=908290 RepID=A0A6B9FT20_9HYPH|nr:hypothetical protein [Methylobacterium mesophilicum]QGY05192.1 hypothetical protein MMSR116_27300 [Methylobacterium mesophilicum SR1.6/6]
MLNSKLSRRNLVAMGSVSMITSVMATPEGPPILSNPVEVDGEWHAPKRSAALVIGRMREACTSGYRISSDRQPRKICVENRPSGPPAVWLHQDRPDTAKIFVDVGERAWSQLAYQFGHEFGHVMCNSWSSDAKPSAPCQWVEEMIVESFSLRGLSLLAAAWKDAPPFPGDSAYGREIERYRDAAVAQYNGLASSQGLTETKMWFKHNRQAVEDFVGLSEYAKAGVTVLLPAMMKNPVYLEDLGALNRWLERAALPLPEYLDRWSASCRDVGSAGHLPKFIRRLFI